MTTFAAFFTFLALGVAGRSAHAIAPFLTPSLPELLTDADGEFPPLPRIPGPAQFMSTVQFAIGETHPQLMQRSQRLVVEQLNDTLSAWPELQNRQYEIRKSGNEVIFYLVTNEDMRAPMQQALSSVIQNLNGRVRARGRSLYYRTSPSRPIGGYLEVVVNDVHTKVRSVAAQSVPLRDLLKELKSRLGNLSYLIPGECADRMVDWSFGESKDEPASEAKSVDAVMSELALLFDLKCEKKNGTYIFSGGCHHSPQLAKRPPPPANDLLSTTFLHNAPISNTQVYFPVLPIGE